MQPSALQNNTPAGIPLGERLRALREGHALSQEDLATQLHLTRQTISGWECGRSQPDIGTVQALSRIYGISVDELLSGVAAENPRPSRWRWLFFGAGTIIFAFLVLNIASMFLAQFGQHTATIGIIGGADGPTSIWVTRYLPVTVLMVGGYLPILNLSASLFSIFFLIGWTTQKGKHPYRKLGIILLFSAILLFILSCILLFSTAGTPLVSLSISDIAGILFTCLINPGFCVTALVGLFSLSRHKKQAKMSPCPAPEKAG